MASVSVQGLSKHFGGSTPTTAIDDLDLDVEEGEFLVLLGPSGCGKTTTLRCVAGLETAERGSISFGERTVFDAAAGINVAPNKRNIGMVFQSYALWPHLTVRKNIGYPLRTRRVKRAVAEEWIAEIAELVDADGLLDRLPAQLSGGQQQRVALARGLVARPDLVLFDEPLSNLDARLRDQVRSEIHELHGRLGFTAVYVTHDQAEALALGDRLAIMRHGALEQLAPPEDIFERPVSEYVAGFIGMANRLVFEVRGRVWDLGGAPVTGDVLALKTSSTQVVARTRPEDIDLASEGVASPPGFVSFPVKVIDSEFGGRHLDIVVTAGTTRVQARIEAGARDGWARSLAPGDTAVAHINPRTLALYEAPTSASPGSSDVHPERI